MHIRPFAYQCYIRRVFRRKAGWRELSQNRTTLKLRNALLRSALRKWLFAHKAMCKLAKKAICTLAHHDRTLRFGRLRMRRRKISGIYSDLKLLMQSGRTRTKAWAIHVVLSVHWRTSKESHLPASRNACPARPAEVRWALPFGSLTRTGLVPKAATPCSRAL